MKSIQKQLLKNLLEDGGCVKAAVLASQLDISIRSVKNYVAYINQIKPNTIQSSKDGYSVLIDQANQLLNESEIHIPQNSKERQTYILNQLMQSTNIKIDSYDLAEELFISMSTLKTELNKIKNTLNDYDLILHSNNEILSITGLEKNKRKLLSTLLYNETNVNFVNLDAIKKAFSEIDIDYIKDVVLETLEQYHYFINDYSLINLILHLTIAIDRIQNGYFNNDEELILPSVRAHENELARLIVDKIENHFNIKYTSAEVYELTLLLVSRAATMNVASINLSNLEDFIGKECMDLVHELINCIANYYYIDLNDPEFFIRFALHIRNLLVRSHNNYFSKNPLTEGIKTSCPLTYDNSVLLASIIQQRTGIHINDDEIAYIAFHLGSAVEAQRNLNNKISAVLYCPNYYDMNLKLVDEINRYFSNDILITNILSDESELSKIRETYLIISTIPLSMHTRIPVIYINIFFKQKDITAIQQKIQELQLNKKRITFESHLRKLIIPELFTLSRKLDNEYEVIEFMVNKLVSMDYVDPTFIDEIYERESISSTAFNDFAIPHAIKMKAKKTGIQILISEDPISWNHKNVRLVMMLCFNKNDRHIFNELFDPLTMILSDNDNMKKILFCRNYEEFINELVMMLRHDY